MSVQNPDVIDFVVAGPRKDEAILVMAEFRDWARVPEAIPQLDAKFQLYARFVISGELARTYPDLARLPISIQLEHYSPITDAVAEALRRWANRLSAIPIRVRSCQRDAGLFNRLTAKLFRRPPPNVIRWEPQSGASEPLITPAKFTEEFIELFQSRRPRFEIQATGKLQVKVTGQNGGSCDGFLGNAYDQFILSPERKGEILQRFAVTLAESVENQEKPVDRNRIVPVLKDKLWFKQVNQAVKDRGKNKAIASVYEPYNEELLIVYAEDTPQSVRYLTDESFAGLNVALNALRPLACANLKRLIPTPDIQFEDGMYRIRAGGDYDACILLLDEFWDTANIQIEGDPVAIVPARDFLAVTGTQNRHSMAKLQQLARQVASQAPYRLTDKLFVRRNRKFVTFDT